MQTGWITFVAFLGLVALVSSFLLPLAMGGVLAVLLSPIDAWVQRVLRVRPWTSAALVTLITSFWVLVPFTALTIAGTRGAVRQLQGIVIKHSASAPRVEPVVDPSPREKLVDWVKSVFPDLPLAPEDGVAWLEDTGKAALSKLGELLAQTVAQLPLLFATLGFVAIGLFFALLDGERLLELLGAALPYSVKQWDSICARGADACRSVVLASLVSGGAQSVLAMVFFFSLQVPNALLLGFLVFLGSFVPVVGSLPLTLGAAIYLAIHRYWVGVIVMLVGVVLISGVDNGIRPWVLRGRTNLHPLLAFLAALGGIQWLGIFGVFLGPIVASLAVTLYDLHWGSPKKSA